MAQSQHRDSWLAQLGLERPPEAVVGRLWDSLTRMCVRATDTDEADAHLWAEGPLPGGLAGCLNCEERRSKGERKIAAGLPRLPWRTKQRYFVLSARRNPLN